MSWLPTPSYALDLKQGDCSIPDPYNSEVYFENEYIGTGPGQVNGLSPGEYHISASNSIYGTGERNVKLDHSSIEKRFVTAIIEMKKDELE